MFCEYAYVIDFDKNTFEVYEGFNTTPLAETDRFYSKELYEYANTQYYPVKLKASFDLSNLPDTDEFLSVCEPKEE